ncbi:MATE family efflux transporter [Candidatus Woesearchaeota archaeon]|nr:MATE family efflux transporter [Candidatus Woesearchaeota archaeon]
MKNHSEKILNGHIGDKLIRMAIPMGFGALAIMLFNIVDTFYISMLSTQHLAAIAFTFPIAIIVHALITGIGMGISVNVSQALGSGHYNKVKRLIVHSLILGFLILIPLSVLGTLFKEQIFLAMGATPDLIPMILDYMTPWFFGIFFLAIPMLSNSIIRSTGNTKTPAYIMMLSGLVNIVVNPILIFGIGPFPRMELFGAILATIFAWFIAGLASLYVLIKKEKLLDLSDLYLDKIKDSFKSILHLALPAIGTNLLMPLTATFLTKLVSQYGNYAVAAYGVATRLQSLSLIGVLALASVMSPFIGQNIGAKKYERVIGTIRFGRKFSFIWGLSIFVIFILSGEYIARIFNNDPYIIGIIVFYMILTSLSYGFFGLGRFSNVSFNAMKKPLLSSIILIIRFFFLVIPLSYFGSKFFGLKGIFYGLFLSNVLYGIIGDSILRLYVNRNLLKKITPN